MKLTTETLPLYFTVATPSNSHYTEVTNCFDFVDRNSDTLVVTVGDSWTWGADLDSDLRLQQVLGLLPFTFSFETVDGVVMETEGDAMEVGKKIYITTPEGQLPTPDGEYEMSSGMKVKVKE